MSPQPYQPGDIVSVRLNARGNETTLGVIQDCITEFTAGRYFVVAHGDHIRVCSDSELTLRWPRWIRA